MAIIRRITQIFIFSMLLLFHTVGFAEVPKWEIVKNESSLSFTGKINNAATSGKFKDFEGDIQFEPENLNKSKVRIVVDTGSVSTSYTTIAETLKTPDWMNSKLFPQAIFEANTFNKTNDKAYEAKGSLTIRGKTQPVIVTFVQEDYSDKKVRIKGSAKLKRTQFGVGQGEWASVSEVADDVTVDFTITAIRKS